MKRKNGNAIDILHENVPLLLTVLIQFSHNLTALLKQQQNKHQKDTWQGESTV